MKKVLHNTSLLPGLLYAYSHEILSKSSKIIIHYTSLSPTLRANPSNFIRMKEGVHFYPLFPTALFLNAKNIKSRN